MKKILITLIVLFGLTIGIVIYKSLPKTVTSVENIHLKMYSVSSKTTHDYRLSRTGENMLVSVYAYPNKNDNTKVELFSKNCDKEVYDAIVMLCKTYDITEWDGYESEDYESSSIDTFELNIIVNGTSGISVKGTADSYPEGIDGFITALQELISSLS